MIIKGQKVLVYRNLNNGMLSVLGANTGLLITHVNDIELEDCTFIVHQSGYDTFKKTKQKNVHAYVKGTVTGFNTETSLIEQLNYIQVYYDPKATNSFYYLDSDNKKNNIIKHCSKCFINHKGVVKSVVSCKTLLLDFFDFVYEYETFRGRKRIRAINGTTGNSEMLDSIKEIDYITVNNNDIETFLEFRIKNKKDIYTSGLTKKETEFIRNISSKSKYWVKL